jgi:peptidoglycan/LPS O-acetylase OafA/YrhL
MMEQGPAFIERSEGTASRDSISAGQPRRADENPGAAEFGANPETHKLASYPALDWLRFVLASAVALGHEGFPFPGPLSAGLAVDIFLALSGWLIGGILIATPVAGLPRFFFNRATRIWIPYAVAILLVYGLAAAREGVDLNWLKYLFYDVTFTHYTFTTFPRGTLEMPLGGTGNHFWSLSIEEQFYLIAPVVMLTLRFGKKLWLWLLLSLVLVAFEVRAAPIALGVAAAITQRDYGAWQARRAMHWLLVALTAILLALLWRYDVSPLRALFAIGVVLSLAFIGPRNRIGLFFGAISYPLYLNHWLGAFVAHAIAKVTSPLSAGADIAVAYGCAVLIGIASWFLVDRLVMKYRAGWYSPARGRALAGIAYGFVGIGLVGGVIIHLRGG